MFGTLSTNWRSLGSPGSDLTLPVDRRLLTAQQQPLCVLPYCPAETPRQHEEVGGPVPMLACRRASVTACRSTACGDHVAEISDSFAQRADCVRTTAEWPAATCVVALFGPALLIREVGILLGDLLQCQDAPYSSRLGVRVALAFPALRVLIVWGRVGVVTLRSVLVDPRLTSCLHAHRATPFESSFSEHIMGNTCGPSGFWSRVALARSRRIR